MRRELRRSARGWCGFVLRFSGVLCDVGGGALGERVLCCVHEALCMFVDDRGDGLWV